MKKWFCLLAVLILSVLLSTGYAVESVSLGEKLSYGDGAFSITVDEIIVKDDGKWQKKANEQGENMFVVAVHLTVENVSYSESYGNFSTEDIGNLISVNDQDGYSLVWARYDFNGSSFRDGNYSIDYFDEIKKGTKTRLSLYYYADKTTTSASVIFGGGSHVLTVPLNRAGSNNTKSDSKKAENENKESAASDADMKALEKRVSDLETANKNKESVASEADLKALEKHVSNLEAEIGKKVASASAAEVKALTIRVSELEERIAKFEELLKNSPSEAPAATATVKPTATPTTTATVEPTVSAEPTPEPVSENQSDEKQWENVFNPTVLTEKYNMALSSVFKTLFEGNDELAIQTALLAKVQYVGIDNNTVVYANTNNTVFFFFGTNGDNMVADNVCCYTSLSDNNAFKNLPLIAFAYAVAEVDDSISFENFGAWVNDCMDGDYKEFPNFNAYCKLEANQSCSITLARKEADNSSTEQDEDEKLITEEELAESQLLNDAVYFLKTAVTYVQSQKLKAFDYIHIDNTVGIMMDGDKAVVLISLMQSDWLQTITYEQGAVVYVEKKDDGRFVVDKDQTIIKEPSILDFAKSNGNFIEVDYSGVAFEKALLCLGKNDYDEALVFLDQADITYRSEKTDECRYNIANQLEEDGDYIKAITIYEEIYYKKNFPDIEHHVINCNYKEATKLMKEKDYLKAAELFGECVDSPDYPEAANQIKECNYLAANEYIKQEKFDEALAVLKMLEDYKDTKELIENVRGELFKHNITNIGSTVYFGTFEQDGDTVNGPEDIEWVVVDVNKGKSLLVSKKILMVMTYNDRNNSSWGSSNIKRWLNGDFYKNAFSDGEKKLISKNNNGNVFILSKDEMEKYFSSRFDREFNVTVYASSLKKYRSYTETWTRTPKKPSPGYPALVTYSTRTGTIEDCSVDDEGGILPAIWVKNN